MIVPALVGFLPLRSVRGHGWWDLLSYEGAPVSGVWVASRAGRPRVAPTRRRQNSVPLLAGRVAAMGVRSLSGDRSTRGAQREALISDLPRLRSRMPSEKFAEVAADFDGMHSIQRAVQVIGESSCGSSHLAGQQLGQPVRRRPRGWARTGRARGPSALRPAERSVTGHRSACEDHQCGGRGESLITGCRSFYDNDQPVSSNAVRSMVARPVAHSNGC